MAELITKSDSGNTKGKGAGVRKSKKMSTRVDLTPMVDLGFLLITFFMLTTSMSHLTSMHLKMPDDNNTPNQAIKQSGALTLWLGGENRLYVYEGKLAPGLVNVQRTNFNDIRHLILQKKNALNNPDDLFVTIMPGEDCTYKNIIDILDELSIDRILSYALVNKVDPAYTGFIRELDQKIN
ncbi:Biopolymer transport protein ExbD [Arachidicoccus rhizosphaerae]|jgi:biopolymer transport protein ExbD|uniref:Biopolymer transport protein ExbD n=1 Tax=Arachidicoccus rhizosphaerae TaxID=551991 RepID=A0A1H3ZXV7_9BACT|nr:biopolymer transporter ExbD [Arachidicoccus rhizosphaerae]SEA28485.1 Biopolymer transport protein ExbD [Arachidicoccus rhizosphaerae]